MMQVELLTLPYVKRNWNTIRKRISSLIDEDGVADVELLGAELSGVDDDRVGNFPAPLA